MRTILRFAAAVCVVVALGLFIYFKEPAPDAPEQDAEKQHDQTEQTSDSKKDFKIAIPETGLDKSDRKEADDLGKRIRSMHATMNHLASEGAFAGKPLNTGPIKQDLEKLNMQLNETKSGCSSCSKDFIQYLDQMQRKTASAMDGSAQALTDLYANMSELDSKLNEAKALADAIPVEQLLQDGQAAATGFTTAEQWIKDAKARLDAQSGDLQIGNPEDLQKKAIEAEKRLQEAKKKAEQAKKLADQAKQGSAEAQKQLQQKAEAAEKEAQRLRNEADQARERLEKAKEQAANTKKDTDAFARQAKQYASQFSKDAAAPEQKAQLKKIQQLSDRVLQNKADRDEKLQELKKAFDALDKE